MKKIVSYFLIVIFLGSSFVFIRSNPRSTQSEKAIPPHAFVIFGATGDLTKRKLVPALLALQKKGELPKEFVCIGVGRRALSNEQFLKEAGSMVQEKDRSQWESFKTRFHYLSGSIEDKTTYSALKALLLNHSKETMGNQLFYLATPESHFSTVVEQLDGEKLLEEKGHFSRVIIEKPFGHDLASAIELQEKLTTHLSENQLYRMDHFLGKEMVRNLLLFRSTHPLLPIDHILFTISEEIGIGGRGSFFEQMGILRDLVQNHAMQMVSLMGMEIPKNLSAEMIQKEKTKFIESIRPIAIEDVFRGQYGPGSEMAGYRQEEGVDPNSTIETYMETTLFIDSPRWNHTPFIIRAGKRLPVKKTEITIYLKEKEGAVVIEVQPNEAIYLVKNGEKMPLKTPLPSGQEAYERLLKDAMEGKKDYFVSYNELAASWRLFDPILNYWKENPPTNFPNYNAGANPPIKEDWHLQINN